MKSWDWKHPVASAMQRLQTARSRWLSGLKQSRPYLFGAPSNFGLELKEAMKLGACFGLFRAILWDALIDDFTFNLGF